MRDGIFEERLEELAKHFEKEGQTFEERLEELAKHFESQTFMEASYNFGVATDAYKVGNNERAIEYYSLVLQSQPNNINVMERLGRAYSNLNDMDNAVYYLERARMIDPRNVPALRSLALCYRYKDREKAIGLLNEALTIDPHDYEAWDFLGLIYRDGGLIDKAINAHQQALANKRRPETQFYLSILYFLKGDRTRAKLMALTADDDAQKKEYAEKLRPVWRILIHCAVYIIENDEEESLRIIQTLTRYITTDRIYDSLKGHLELLLAATGHKEWTAKFLEIVKVRGT
jgi:tetratricopeptide (TPR) repeat protein